MRDIPLYPLTFKPIFKELVWGGRRLEKVLGKPLPPDRRIGESWELVDLPGDMSVVNGGDLDGSTLRSLVEKRKLELMGNTPLLDGRFPLLLKFIDAAERLSVQVHPDREAAERLGGRPKTEAWHIIDAAPGCFLYIGTRPGVTREVFAEAIDEDRVEPLLRKVPVHPGDLIYLPAGTLHAIGEGVLLAEIQQASDTTYRVFDWGRMGLDGRPRPLHVKEALESIRFDVRVAPLDGSGPERLLTPYFGIERKKGISGAIAEVIPAGLPRVLIGLSGSGRVHGGGGESQLSKGTTILIPASLDTARIELALDSTWLEVSSCGGDAEDGFRARSNRRRAAG